MLSQFYSIQITFIHLIQNPTLIQFKSLIFSIQTSYIQFNLPRTERGLTRAPGTDHFGAIMHV